MKIKLPKIFNQLDPAWKDKRFGTSATIGQYGCLICCVAMVCQYYGKNETPASLVDKVKFQGNLWIWGELPRLYPDITYQGLVNTPDPLTKTQMDYIRARIDEGYPVFLQIDQVPATSRLDEHWVLAVDYNGDDFLIANPWGGSVHPITNYGVQPQKIIYAYAWYKGKPALSQGNYYKGIDLNNLDSIKVCVDTWHEVAVQQLYIKKDEHQRIISDKDNTINNLNQQISSLTASINQLNQEKKMLSDQLMECQKILKEKEDTYNNLIKEVEALRQDKIQFEKFKAEWQIKEIEYQKQIKTLQTKLDKYKSPMKKLLVDIWLKVSGQG